MPRPIDIQAIIEEAVSDVFEASLPHLRAEIVRHAMEQVAPLVLTEQASAVAKLNGAAAAIEETISQAEILRRLLDGAALAAGRAALFVVKGKSISGWHALGFEDNDSVKTFNLDTTTGLVARAVQDRTFVQGDAEDFDAGFAATVGPPADGACLVLPLVVKQKVAAIIYADAGAAPDGIMDSAALQLLTRFAALWIEVIALRKASGIEEAPAAPAPAPPAVAAEAAAPPAVTTPAIAPEDTELHNKARRFAKLLVEEIKLYNGPKVAEGRQNRDLYERLKDDIAKSRASYDKRYAETTVASVDHFTEQLIRILADNDVSLMGASFPG